MSPTTLTLLVVGALLVLALPPLLSWFTARRATAEPGSVAWEGFRPFRVARREYENAERSVCSFYLEPLDGKPLAAYLPGQFLAFNLPIDGAEVVRCYSLSDAPRGDHYRISVKRVGPTAAQPEIASGLASNYLHDQVQVGDTLQARAPAGPFVLRQGLTLPVVLVAGGIGITPLLSMLLSALEQGSEREFWLFYGVRNSAEAIRLQQLRELAVQYGNFHLQLCYSAPTGEEVAGVDFQHTGRVNLDLLRSTLPEGRHHYYVCGPKGMMESLIPALHEAGVAERDVFYESFGPALLIGAHGEQSEVDQPPPTITFSRTGRSLAWNSDSESLLEFIEDNGIEVKSGCRAGSCGSCVTRRGEGEVEYLQQPEFPVGGSDCLLCVSIPKGDLTLDL